VISPARRHDAAPRLRRRRFRASAEDNKKPAADFRGGFFNSIIVIEDFRPWQTWQ
jgi:hypothetical protein